MPCSPHNTNSVGIVTSVFVLLAHQMFDQITSQLTSERRTTPEATLPNVDSEQLLQEISERLEQDVPAGPYVPDKWLAGALGVAHKTLMNRRVTKPGRYPEPLHLFDGQAGMHPRREIVEWLAREEMRAKTRRVHKCS